MNRVYELCAYYFILLIRKNEMIYVYNVVYRTLEQT